METKSLLKIWILLLVTFGTAFSLKSEAAKTTSGQEPTFIYEVIQPENQVDTSVGYFDLHMTPEQRQTIQIRLKNPSSAEMTIEVSLNGATTNSNGVIEYGLNDIAADASLQHALQDIASAPQEVVLKPGAEALLDIQLVMPKEQFAGYIAGGIRLMRQGQESNAMVVNQTAYMIGLRLSEQQSAEIADIPERLRFNRVYPELYNHRNALMVSLSNTQPIYMEGVSALVQIMSIKDSKVLYELEQKDMRMAPNTQIALPVSLQGEKMLAGDYVAKINIISEKGGRWQWREHFSVSKAAAEKFNAYDLSIEEEAGTDDSGLKKILAGISGILVIGALYIYYIMKQKRLFRN